MLSLDKEFNDLKDLLEKELMPNTLPQILICDDDEMDRRLIKTSLKDCDCILVEAKDGEEAIKYGLSGDFQIIIIDIIMPKANGLEVVYALKETESVKIICTGLDLTQDVIKQVKRIGGHIVEKCRIHEIGNLIKSLLNNE